MAIKVIVQIDGAADWLDADANASYRLDRDDSSSFASPTEVTTATLTTGTERYEVWDTNGDTSSWYRFRVEDDGDVALSDWSIPFQVVTAQEIATLASVKLRLGSGASQGDDDILQGFIDAANGAIIQRLGYYPGPSDDTTRTYHGKDAKRDGKRLWVPGGVRTVTTLTVGASTGASKTAASSDDYILGPESYLLRSGEPYQYIEFVDITSGNWSNFPFGYSNVTITGWFGWNEPPADLVAVASAWAIRQWKARAAGNADIIGTDEFGDQIISDRFPAQWRRTIDAYRFFGAA